jgi:SGNH domain (fused to AT3 domains)
MALITGAIGQALAIDRASTSPSATVPAGQASPTVTRPDGRGNSRRRAGAETFAASKKNPITSSANAKLAAMQGPFTLIDVMSKVCPRLDFCHVVTPDQNIIFFDGAHFTPAGARYIGRLLLESGAFEF